MKTISFKRYTDSQGVYAEVLHNGVNVGHGYLQGIELKLNGYLAGFLNTYTNADRLKIELKLRKFLLKETL